MREKHWGKIDYAQKKLVSNSQCAGNNLIMTLFSYFHTPAFSHQHQCFFQQHLLIFRSPSPFLLVKWETKNWLTNLQIESKIQRHIAAFKIKFDVGTLASHPLPSLHLRIFRTQMSQDLDEHPFSQQSNFGVERKFWMANFCAQILRREENIEGPTMEHVCVYCTSARRKSRRNFLREARGEKVEDSTHGRREI